MGRRRSGLPADIKQELSTRANAGVGLDPEFPTRTGNDICPAATACRRTPSDDMLAFVRTVMAYLKSKDAIQVRLVQDFRDRGQPGALLLVWSNGPSASEIASQFAVSRSACGTPRLPSWLSLRVDNDFDLRWQPAY
jgi:hypothetical protein